MSNRVVGIMESGGRMSIRVKGYVCIVVVHIRTLASDNLNFSERIWTVFETVHLNVRFRNYMYAFGKRTLAWMLFINMNILWFLGVKSSENVHIYEKRSTICMLLESEHWLERFYLCNVRFWMFALGTVLLLRLRLSEGRVQPSWLTQQTTSTSVIVSYITLTFNPIVCAPSLRVWNPKLQQQRYVFRL
jgi:hypothetical protein